MEKKKDNNDKTKKSKKAKSNRSDGRFEIKRTITLPNGEKKRKPFYGAGEREAIKNYEDYLKNQNKEEVKRTIYYFADAADGWLETKEGTEKATYKEYKGKVKALKKHWPDDLIDEIKNADIVKYLNTISKGLAESTVKKFILVLNGIFEYAIDNDRLIKNPMRRVGEKKIKVPKTARKAKKKRWYTQEHERLLIDYSKTQGINGLTVFIPLKAGTRPQETMALYPERDIDFEAKTLHIQEAFKAADSNRIGNPKSETSNRIIPVDDEFLDHIKSFGFTGYIFDNGTGIPKNYTNWKKRNFNRFMDSIPLDKEEFKDFPKLDPHEMRHTHGTLLYERGTDLYTIMRLMGHADIKVTQVYVHQSIETLRDKVKRVKE